MMRFDGNRIMISSLCLSMISAQTPSAFVARENRFPLFRIMLLQVASEQRRDLRDLQRSDHHRTIGEAQREGARLASFQCGLLTERVDARGHADIGVLL